MFIVDNIYVFAGNPEMIEGNHTFELIPTHHYLGRFIEYIGVHYLCDWLPDGKAVFENGTVFIYSYDKIILYDNDYKPPSLVATRLLRNASKKQYLSPK